MENCIPLRGDKSVRSTPYTKCQGRLRKRPNHELEYLRQQVIDLEEELAVLRQPDIDILSWTETLELGDDETWQDVAAIQKTEANVALTENLQLRTVFEGQLRVMRTLESAIDQHWKKASQARRWFTGEAERPQPANLSDELLYALLEEDMMTQYASVDKVLEASAVTRVNSEFAPKLLVKQGADGVSFHHCGPRERGTPMLRCQKLWKGDNCARATTAVKLHLPNAQEVEVKTRLVQRAFPEATRTVYLWAAYVEIEGSMFVRLEEKGWIVLEPYHFKKRGCVLSTPGSILRSVVRVTPILQFRSKEEETQHVDELTDLVIGTYNRNFGLLYQVLENIMLDSAMNERERNT